MKKLSIIIPCYNCVSTLEEALASVYKQDIKIPFEIVMVNDGSADGTADLINKLAARYNEIKIFSHSRNRGGGAARNTGIKNSTGDLIFCLDSDNFFAPRVLGKMVDFIIERKGNGAVIEERRFFVGNNSDKFQSHFNRQLDRSINLEDIFIPTGGGTLLDNFLFTREAYERAGGYPENHGFDTQCFEIRFLSRNDQTYVCPGSVFYHRQSADSNSYFQRVYKSGLFSRNFYLICEDIMPLFSRSARRLIFEFDIFGRSKLGENNLKAKLDDLYSSGSGDLFMPDKLKYAGPQGADIFIDEFKTSREIEDIFCLGVLFYRQGKIDLAWSAWHKLLSSGTDSKVLYFNILRTSLALSGKYEQQRIEDEVGGLIASMSPQKQRVVLWPTWMIGPYLKLKKFYGIVFNKINKSK